MAEITEEQAKKISDAYNEYEVIGAGGLRISKDNNWRCGNEEGFSIGVEWGKHGYSGGVISNEEALRLDKYIIRTNNLNNLLGDE